MKVDTLRTPGECPSYCSCTVHYSISHLLLQRRFQPSAMACLVPGLAHLYRELGLVTWDLVYTNGKLPSSKMTDEFIHLFTRNLLTTYNVPGTVMDAADTKVNHLWFLHSRSLHLRNCKNVSGLVSSILSYK